VRHLALLLLLLGCSSEASPPTESTVAAPESLPEPTAEVTPARRALSPGSPCGRAAACCEAYAEAFGNVVAASACAGPVEAAAREDADARCDRMREGWRLALAHHAAAEPPAACAADQPSGR